MGAQDIGMAASAVKLWISPTKFNVIENFTCRYGSKPINSTVEW
jgi:hypothetical protein